MDFEGKTLAVIGASYLQLPLILKARSMGVRTIAFAWADGAVCKDYADEFLPISIVDKEAILAVCRERRIDGVTTIATDVAVPTVAYVAHHLGLIGNSESSAYVSTNKFAMRKALSAAGVNCPRFALVHDADEALARAAELRFPLIVKPCDRSGSMGVCKLTDISQVTSAVCDSLQQSLCKEAILEEFIADACEISVEGISWRGEHYVLAVTDKITTGAPHYVELGHHQPSGLPPEIIAEAIRQVKSGVKALGIEYGASHPELMITPDHRVYVTEIGARMGGDFIGSDLVHLSTGYDFVRGVIEVALGAFTVPAITEKHCSGVWFLSEKTPQVLEYIRAAAAHPEIVKAEVQSDILVSPLTKSSERSGFFIYQAEKRMTV